MPRSEDQGGLLRAAMSRVPESGRDSHRDSSISCRRCGKEIPGDSTFCPFCGVRQAATPGPGPVVDGGRKGGAGAVQPQAPPPASPAEQSRPKKGKKKKPVPGKLPVRPIAIGVLGVILILVMPALLQDLVDEATLDLIMVLDIAAGIGLLVYLYRARA